MDDETTSNIIMTSIYLISLIGICCGYGYWLYSISSESEDDNHFVSDIVE